MNQNPLPNSQGNAVSKDKFSDMTLAGNDPWGFKKRWLWLGCVLLVIVAASQSANRSIGGGDTWVAMANGRYTMGPWAAEQEHRTLQMKALDLFGIHMTKQDYMGAMTRDYIPGDPEEFGWVNQNWLTHVMFYKMRAAWGENSIVVYKFIQAILTALFAFWAARKLGAHPVLAAATAAFGMLLSRSFIDLRPNQSTIFYAAAMMLALIHWRSGKFKAILWLIPIMLLWSNVHGGFIYAMMVMAVVLAGHFVQNFLGKYAHFFLLFGGLVAVILIVNGVSGLRGEIAANSSLKEAYLPWLIAGGLSAAAIMFLIIFSLVRIFSINAAGFVRVGTKGFYWLIAGGAIVILVSGIFSPFGWENILHPLVIALGNEGEIWRRVVEWRPIWDEAGFGNAGPYCYFLLLFAVTWFFWWLLLLLKPADSNTKQNNPADKLHWPKIDLAFIGVIAITLIMSIKSRRFIFLGGVILAPFLAQMGQEIAAMTKTLMQRRQSSFVALLPSLLSVILGGIIGRALAIELLIPWLGASVGAKIVAYGLSAIFALAVAGSIWYLWQKTVISKKVVQGVAALSWVAVILLALLFGFCMYDTYYSPATDGLDLTVFRRMVGIPAQPVDAIKFFDDNQLDGIVFNEWVNGGFITFFQTPQEANGQARCKVYMDGRAQAAYPLEHFQRWNMLKVVLPRPNSRVQHELMQLGRENGIASSGRDFYDELWQFARSQAGRGNPQILNQVSSMIGKDRDIYAAVLRDRVSSLGQTLGLDPDQPDFCQDIIRIFVDELPRLSGIVFPVVGIGNDHVELSQFSPTDQPKIRTLAQHCGFSTDDTAQLAQLCTSVGRYGLMCRMAAGYGQLYDALLTRDSVNVVLLDDNKPSTATVAWLLMDLPQWRLFYLDYKNILLIRNDGIRNQQLFTDPLGNAVYENDNARLISQGYALTQTSDPVLMNQGFEMLIQADFDQYIGRVYDAIYSAGRSLNRFEDIYEYFQGRYLKFKQRIDNHETFGMTSAFAHVLHSCSVLATFSGIDDGVDYNQQRQHYQQLNRDFISQTRSRLLW